MANMFTSELATMFSSDLVNMFMSELETWKNMTCIKNATLHLVIETLMDECKRRTSFTLFAVNVPHYQLSCIPKKWLCSMQRSFKKRIIYFSFLFYFFFFFGRGGVHWVCKRLNLSYNKKGRREHRAKQKKPINVLKR